MAGADIYERYLAGVENNTERMREGIQNCTKDPTALAVAQKAKMKANLIKRIDDGTWEKNLKAAGKARWQANSLAVGVDKVSAGIRANQDKITAAFEKVDQAAKAVQNAVASMPKATLADSLARVKTSMEIQRQVHGKT